MSPSMPVVTPDLRAPSFDHLFVSNGKIGSVNQAVAILAKLLHIITAESRSTELLVWKPDFAKVTLAPITRQKNALFNRGSLGRFFGKLWHNEESLKIPNRRNAIHNSICVESEVVS